MRCPKCDSPMPIGGKVCKNCNFNAFTNQYESAPVKPVKPVRQPAAQQPVRQTPVQQPAAPRAVPQRPAVNPTPAPKPVQQAAPAQKPQQSTVKPQKKKTGWATRIVSAILAVVVAHFAGNMVGNLMGRSGKQDFGSTSYQVESIKKEPSADFTALLAEQGISYTSKIWTMSSECFAMALDDYTFEILEYGYVGDTVKEQYDTIYYDVSAFNESEIQQIESNIKSSVETNMPYCTAEYSRMGSQFLVVQLHIDNLDDSETISAMAAAGRVALENGKVPNIISMNVSRQGLLGNGYIQ